MSFKVFYFPHFLGGMNSGSREISFSELHFSVVFVRLDDSPWNNNFSFSSETFALNFYFPFIFDIE